MGSNIIELAKLGHERAAELKASCGAVDVRSLAQLISDLATQLEVQLVRGNEQAVQLANAESKCRELAADNERAMDSLKQADAAVKLAHEKFSALADENMALKSGHYNGMVLPETPATDAFLAEVRASAIPEGYVLVPQEMHLSSEAMEGICFHCGDGGFSFGEFTDGLLFVGAIDDSDGQKIHGLHIATADYPEEGCATICEFLSVPHRGAAQ